ncbi:MAG TPA: ABC transporter permease, partial [Bryobacteraceae bacterium]|nr:ABC transporter permease [Bryobacteraceae bacterium]
MISWFKHRKVREQELERELAYHLAKLAEENRDDGQNPADAHSGARRQLGNATLIKERMREVWRWSFADQCWQDLRYAFRSLHGSPAFTIIAILTLGLAIGANTAIFSVLESVLFRQLPYPDPSRLVLLSDPQDPDDGGLLYQDYQAWKAQTRTFDALAIYYRDSGWSRITLTGQGEPQTVQGAFVSANFFSVMGVRPLLGRSFTPEEEALHERIVVLSHALWTSRFGRSPDVIGQSLQID